MNLSELKQKHYYITEQIREKNKFDEAIAEYKKIIPQAKKLKFYEPIQQLGVTYYIIENYSEAEKCFEEAIQLGIKANDLKVVGNTLRDEGIVLIRKKRFNEAIEKLEQSQKYLVNCHDYVGIAATTDKLGVAYAELTDFQEAINLINASRIMCKYLTDEIARYYHFYFTYDLANVYYKIDMMDTALKYATIAFEGCLETGNMIIAKEAEKLIEKIESSEDSDKNHD